MNGLIKTITPRTVNGKEYKEWGKLLTGLTEDETIDGVYCDRGSSTYVKEGDLYLECAGYKSMADAENYKDQLFILWMHNGATWAEVYRTKERAWRELIVQEMQRWLR